MPDLLALIAWLCQDAQKWAKDRSFSYALAEMDVAMRAAEVHLLLVRAPAPEGDNHA